MNIITVLSYIISFDSIHTYFFEFITQDLDNILWLLEFTFFGISGVIVTPHPHHLDLHSKMHTGV